MREAEDGRGADGHQGAAADQTDEQLVAAAGLGRDAVGLDGLLVGGVVAVLAAGHARGLEADGETGEAHGEARQEGEGPYGERRAQARGLHGRQVREDGDERREHPDGRREDEGHEGTVAARRDQGEDHGGEQYGRAGQQELEPSDPLVVGEGQQTGARHRHVRQGAESQGDGRAAVVVDPGAHAGEDDEEEAGHRGEDALEAVHVVVRLGRPRDEGQEGGQDAAADESGAAGQVAVPQGAVAGDGRGDRFGDVVEDGRRQRLGERAQGEQLAVEDALRGEGPGAVEDGAVAAYEVVADRRALGGALLGEPQDLRVEVGDRDVVGQCDIDPAVGRDDGDAAEAEARAGPEGAPVPAPPVAPAVAEAEAVMLTCCSPSVGVSGDAVGCGGVVYVARAHPSRLSTRLPGPAFAAALAPDRVKCPVSPGGSAVLDCASGTLPPTVVSDRQ